MCRTRLPVQRVVLFHPEDEKREGTQVLIVSLCDPVRSTEVQSIKQALQQGFTSRSRWLLQILGLYLLQTFFMKVNRMVVGWEEYLPNIPILL